MYMYFLFKEKRIIKIQHKRPQQQIDLGPWELTPRLFSRDKDLALPAWD